MAEKHKHDEAFAKVAHRALYGLMGLEKLMSEDRDFEDVRVREIRVKPPAETGSDYLVTVKAVVGGRLIVGWHGAGSFDEALRGAYERILNNNMKWRDDQPWAGK